MRVLETSLPGVLLLEVRIFRDPRGHFLEAWHERRYRELGLPGGFVQDNVSVSRRGVLRGLHYQHPFGQGKLISALEGEIWDVAVDIRVGSESFGRWYGCSLSAENGRQLYIPEGFAHGFVVLSERATVTYKCTEYYHPEAERALRWDDPDLAIEWPVRDPILSDKDREASLLRSTPPDHLPQPAVAP